MINSKSIVNRIYSFLEPLFREPKKHLKTWLVILGVLVASWALVFFLRSPKVAEASWWDETWLYRQAITTTNGSNYDAENVPYRLIIDTETLISNSKMQANGEDIRIIDSDGKVVRFQVEQSTLNTSETGIWFEADIPANSSKIYYIYYGNQIASELNFDNDVDNIENDGEIVEMKDGYGYSTSANNARVSDIRKNNTNLKTNGNYHHTTGYPGNWWNDRNFSRTLLASGPLFVEVKYEDTNYGDYSSLGTNIKLFSNGFAEVRVFMNYNTSGTDTLYYYLHFDNDTRNSVWIDGSGDLSDIDNNSGTLYESDLGDNWFGQRWTNSDYYGGTIILKNGSDWYKGATSTRASYYQTNYSYNIAYSAGDSREVRYGIFAGDGGLDEMVSKASSYGNATILLGTEEISPGPVAYWKFDEGEGTTAHDSSGQGNDGTINGATWQTEDMCISGKCLEFDGTNNIEIPNPLHQDNLNQEWTVKAWIKLANNVEIGTQYLISSFNLGLRLNHHSANKPLLYLNSGIDDYYIYGTQDLKDNNWHHVTFIFRNSDGLRKIYIDGKDDSSSGPNHTSTPAGISDTIYLGTGTIGFIDEIKIYPYARTEEQIKSDYAAGSGPKGAGAVIGHRAETAQITPISSKLVAHWKFDEGYGSTAHDHIGGNHGTLSGTTIPEWTNEGKVGKALDFSIASGYINAGNDQSLDITGELTISAWANLATLSDGANFGLVDRGNYSQYQLKIDNSQKVVASLWHNNTRRDYCYGQGSSINLGQWEHVAITYDGTGTVKSYLNGKEQCSHTRNDGPIDSKTATLQIGKASSYYWNGLIDEVKIYNTALTQEEILQDYNQGMAAVMGRSSGNTGSTAPGGSASQEYCVPGSTDTCRPPVAEWKFDEKTGDKAHDTSGNNNEGTLVNNPTWRSTAFCKEGGCLEFDGSNYISRNSFSGLTGKSGATIEFLAQPTTLAEGSYAFWADSNTLIEIGCSSTFGCDENDARVRWHLDGAWRNSHIATDNVEENQWAYWVFLFDSGNTKIYKNGVEVYSGSDSQTSITSSNSDYYIGYREEGYNNFNGLIDQVRIYDYARTPAQIAWDYNRGGPVGHWRFDECQGTTAYDVSGNDNHGTINIGSSAPQTSAGTCVSGNSAHAWYNGREGKINSGISLDGVDDYVTRDLSVSGTNATISFWVKNPAQGAGVYLLRSNANVRTYFTVSSTNIGFYKGDPSVFIASSSIPPSNTWSHLVMKWWDEGGTLYGQAYLNGQALNSPKVFTNSNDGGYITLGGFTQSGTQNASGIFDDLRYFNYALTGEQIKVLYNGGAAVRF